MHRLISFALVGLLATVIHVAVASVLITALGWRAALANGAAFCVATSASYALNSRLTFQQALSGRTLQRFLAVAVAGLGLSMLISGAAERFGMHYLGGIGLVVTSVPLLSYLAHSRWTYRT